MAVSKTVLGMNARNFLYIKRYNPSEAKRMADDKLLTKELLIRCHIATPRLLARFSTREATRQFHWQILPEEGFVVKPARGYGGGGILVFKSWKENLGTTITGELYTVKRLESHILDILDGAFSLQYLPDKAFVEERVIPHPLFQKLKPLGLPDLRFIVFNHVPIMAMLRLPTKESHGKANLHLGAIGLGVDIRTGITTHAIYRDDPISRLPGTKIKTSGIKFPQWDKLLLLSTQAASISDLGYSGIDIVLDGKRGPLVLEINARPGLSIQNANLASLRERLERVENMPIPSPERGVEVAKSLFSEPFSEKVKTKPKVLDVIEYVTLGYKGKVKTVKAKIDTGAYRTSIDKSLAEELDLPMEEETLLVKAASGNQRRSIAKITFVLSGKKIKTTASITDRSHMQYPMIVGRRNLKGFIVNPELGDNEPGDELNE